MTKLPTCFQALTLEKLMTGWELLIEERSEFELRCLEASKVKVKNKERIYWRKYDARFQIDPYLTTECESPKRKRYFMSHMERYGWVEKLDTGWTITEVGRQVMALYKGK